VVCYDRLRLSIELKEGNPRDSIYGPYWTWLEKGQRLTRTDEVRNHLRDRAGNDLDRAAPDTSLRFSRGLGVKSCCKVKNLQRRRARCTSEFETHWVKGKVGHPVRHHKLRLGYLGSKWNTLPRLTNGGGGARRRWSLP
jgi:hypothetical protein